MELKAMLPFLMMLTLAACGADGAPMAAEPRATPRATPPDGISMSGDALVGVVID